MMLSDGNITVMFTKEYKLHFIEEMLLDLVHYFDGFIQAIGSIDGAI
jgi:hypothetical protein